MLYLPGAIPDPLQTVKDEYSRRLIVEERRYRETILQIEDEFHREYMRVAQDIAESE